MSIKKGQKIHSEEWKNKLKEKMIGNKYALGLIHSQKTKDFLSRLHKGGNKGSFKKGIRLDKRKRVSKVCVICLKEFEVKQSWASFTRCCSRVCGFQDRATRQIGRKVHTNEFKRKLSERNSRGGVTPENRKLRGSEEYKKWRSTVFQRDNFTCQDCGQVGGILNADHELPFSLFPSLRFEVLNGRTLCVKCHKKLPNTEKQLLTIHMFDKNHA